MIHNLNDFANNLYSTDNTRFAMVEIVVIHRWTIGTSWGVTSGPLGTHQNWLPRVSLRPIFILNSLYNLSFNSVKRFPILSVLLPTNLQQCSLLHCHPMVGIPGIFNCLTSTPQDQIFFTHQGTYHLSHKYILCSRTLMSYMKYHFAPKVSFQNLNIVATRCCSVSANAYSVSANAFTVLANAAMIWLSAAYPVTCGKRPLIIERKMDKR